MVKEPAGWKQVANKLKAALGNSVNNVGIGYALQSRLDPPEKARWTLFVYAENPDAVKVDPIFEGYPVQVRSIPKAYSV